MDNLPAPLQNFYEGDFRAADGKIAAGRVAETTAERHQFWNYWQDYVKPFKVDPFLLKTPFATKVRLATGFAERVRSGYYGNGNRVTCGRVQTALRAITQTCQLDHGQSPLHINKNEYLRPLTLLFSSYRREDPVPVPELAAPVSLVEQMFEQNTMDGTLPKAHAVADFGLIAFYYLLRIGEYTHKRRNGTTRTVQFRFKDVAFKKGNSILPRNAPLLVLLTATSATLKLSNQKNGIRGSLIHRSSNSVRQKYCPVKALARRFHTLRQNNADPDTLLSTYWDGGGKHQLQPDDMLEAIRVAAIQLKLETQGIPATRLGTHSLRAGGAMALKLAGADRDDIKKFGRWSSDTFLIYIHDQIATYQEGWTDKMAQHHDFFNLEGAFSTLTILQTDANNAT